jgi:hypothetical protein
MAHLSSTATSLPAIAGSATGGPRLDATPFEPDRWNRSQVERRSHRHPQELLDEFDEGTTRLVDRLADLPLERPVAIGTYAGLPLVEAMGEMLGHQRRHIDDLERALRVRPEA